MARILVINPNSSAVVTAAMDRALDPLRAADGPEIVCVTNRDGPAGIESQADADLAAVQTAAMVAAASAAGADAPDDMLSSVDVPVETMIRIAVTQAPTIAPTSPTPAPTPKDHFAWCSSWACRGGGPGGVRGSKEEPLSGGSAVDGDEGEGGERRPGFPAGEEEPG